MPRESAQSAYTLAHNSSTSLLTPLERWLQKNGVPLVPAWCGTRMLTLATLPISIGIVTAGWLSRTTTAWLWCVSLLIAAQWVTDTLDGAVGRARNEGFVRWGYYMDHFLDYVFLCSMVLGYALMVPSSALWFVGISAVLAGFMVNTFLLVAATGEFKISFYGIGPTELRLLFIAANSYVAVRGSLCIEAALPWVLLVTVVSLAVFVYLCQQRLCGLDRAAYREKIEPNSDRNVMELPPLHPPEWIEVLGHVFRLAKWKQPYRGVVLQYREHKPVDSMHLFVRADGSYIINHVDEFNPDCGHPVRHFLVDYVLGATRTAL